MHDEMDYELYVLAEISYKKEHHEIAKEKLFPKNWYSCKEYPLKTEIIAEALDNRILIEKTELYKEAQTKGLF